MFFFPPIFNGGVACGLRCMAHGATQLKHCLARNSLFLLEQCEACFRLQLQLNQQSHNYIYIYICFSFTHSHSRSEHPPGHRVFLSQFLSASAHNLDQAECRERQLEREAPLKARVLQFAKLRAACPATVQTFAANKTCFFNIFLLVAQPSPFQMLELIPC